MKTQVISAFPCCGKSYIYNKFKNKYKILDSDSSNFSWITVNGVRTRNPDFPHNYIQHIKENIGKVDYIFVSSHLEVRQALDEEDIPFMTFYPHPDMLNEWIGRMYQRGDNKYFIDFQINNWNNFTNNIVNEPYGYQLIRLKNNQYITDYIYF